MRVINNIFLKNKVKLALVPALLFVFISLDVFAYQVSDMQLKFDAASFEFTYTLSDAPELINRNNRKQYDIEALTTNFWQLPTERAYFNLTYAYIKNYGRTYKEKVTIHFLDEEIKINSLAPLRKLSIGSNELPLHLLVSENIASNNKATFQYTLSKKLVDNFCAEMKCQIDLSDITGKKQIHRYKKSAIATTSSILGLGVYGITCKESCTAFNSKSLRALSEQLNIKVIDVSNQQMIFNETILCESGVLKNCKNGFSDSNKNTIEWHVMENQLVMHQQKITQDKRFFQGEVLIAFINPMMNETRKVTTVFARHKNKQQLIELLINKTVIMTKTILVQLPN